MPKFFEYFDIPDSPINSNSFYKATLSIPYLSEQ